MVKIDIRKTGIKSNSPMRQNIGFCTHENLTRIPDTRTYQCIQCSEEFSIQTNPREPLH